MLLSLLRSLPVCSLVQHLRLLRTWRPMHLAAMHGDVQLIGHLVVALDQAATEPSASQWTSLHYAAAFNRVRQGG